MQLRTIRGSHSEDAGLSVLDRSIKRNCNTEAEHTAQILWHNNSIVPKA